MSGHFKRPKSKLAARKKKDLWAGCHRTPIPPPLEKRHRWMGGKPDSAAAARAGRELGATTAAERAGTLTPDYSWLDDLPDAAEFWPPKQPD